MLLIPTSINMMSVIFHDMRIYLRGAVDLIVGRLAEMRLVTTNQADATADCAFAILVIRFELTRSSLESILARFQTDCCRQGSAHDVSWWFCAVGPAERVTFFFFRNRKLSSPHQTPYLKYVCVSSPLFGYPAAFLNPP